MAGFGSHTHNILQGRERCIYRHFWGKHRIHFFRHTHTQNHTHTPMLAKKRIHTQGVGTSRRDSSRVTNPAYRRNPARIVCGLDCSYTPLSKNVRILLLYSTVYVVYDVQPPIDAPFSISGVTVVLKWFLSMEYTQQTNPRHNDQQQQVALNSLS